MRDAGLVEHLGAVEVTDRDVFLVAIDAPERLPTLRLGSRHHVVLVAGDLHRASDAALHRLATALVDAGAVYLCAWGVGAERFHDACEDVLVGAESERSGDTAVMTTWHDATLEEAIAFLLADACPSRAYLDSCRAALVVFVAPAPEAAAVRRALADPAEFLARMAAPDDDDR